MVGLVPVLTGNLPYRVTVVRAGTILSPRLCCTVRMFGMSAATTFRVLYWGWPDRVARRLTRIGESPAVTSDVSRALKPADIAVMVPDSMWPPVPALRPAATGAGRYIRPWPYLVADELRSVRTMAQKSGSSSVTAVPASAKLARVTVVWRNVLDAVDVDASVIVTDVRNNALTAAVPMNVDQAPAQAVLAAPSLIEPEDTRPVDQGWPDDRLPLTLCRKNVTTTPPMLLVER